MILYGAPVKEKIKEELMIRIKGLKKTPVLAIIQVGDREDSNIYIKQKQKFGTEIGAEVKCIKIIPGKDRGEDENVILKEIDKLNQDENIDGIIIQLPLPEGFNTEKILNSVLPEKDADGLAASIDPMAIPATARGVLTLLDFYNISVKSKKIAIIGQSILAGKPISDELEKRGAEIFRCDINTKNIPEICQSCDILISAVGKPGLITKEFVKDGQIVVDVGISKMEGKIAGDAAFFEIEPIVAAITPVPGGVGPLTVACLFLNLLDLISPKQN